MNLKLLKLQYCLSFFCGLFSQFAFSEILVHGKVMEKGKGIPILDAVVYETEAKSNLIKTNSSGEFTLKLKNNSKGYTLKTEGYLTLNVTIDAQNSSAEKSSGIQITFSDTSAPRELKIEDNGENIQIDATYLLEPSADILSTGIIRARKKTEVSQQTIKRDEFTKMPGAGNDPIKSLQSLPSVIPAGRNSSAIVIRGSTAEESNYFFDRQELPIVFHFGGLGTIIPSRMLESIDLYAGGFSSIYHNATGGIIQMRSENIIPERTSGEFELGILQSSAFLEGNIGEKKAEGTEANNEQLPIAKDNRIGYRLGFRRTYLEVLTPLVKKLNAQRGNTLSIIAFPQATDSQVLINGNHSSGTWQAYIFGINDGMELAIPIQSSSDSSGKEGFRLDNSYLVTGGRYNSNLGNGWGITISPNYSLQIIDNQIIDNSIYYKVQNYTLDLSVEKRFSSSVTATIGFRPEYLTSTTNIDAIVVPPNIGPFTDFESLDRATEKRKENNYHFANWYDFVIKPTTGLTLNPGILLQRGDRSAQKSADPRFNARYQITDVYAIKGAVGLYSKRPEAAYSSVEYGNPNLTMEKAAHYVLGIDAKLTEYLIADVQVYYKDMWDITSNAVKDIANKYENSGKGRAKGFEVFLKKERSDRWFGWFSYGLSKAERYDPVKREWHIFKNDVTHSLTALSSYRLTGTWEISSRFNYKTGTPYTKILGGEFNQNTGRYQPIPGPEFNARRADEISSNFRTDYDVLYDTWKITYFADLQWNINTVVGNRRSPDYSGEGEKIEMIPVIPNLGLTASF